MADSPLTVTQFAILRTLQRNGPTPLSRLADDLIMERTSLYRTIAPLEDLKAVGIKEPTTGRARVASITKAGEKLVLKATPYWESAQNEVVGLVGKQQWKVLQETLLDIPVLLAESKKRKYRGV